MALIDDFKARFPEFTPADVDTAWSGLEASWPCLYGGAYDVSGCDDEIILNLIAHLFVLSQKTNNSPSLLSASKSVGSVSVSNYINQSMTNREAFFSSTKYGQQFNMMTQFRQGSAFV